MMATERTLIDYWTHYRTPNGGMLHKIEDKTQLHTTAREERITCPICLECIEVWS